ncbi:MAG: methyltransferase domain-containing protein [Burkholderiales bacterium]|nr:methyltransferase domain-containing protein [Burkholderiales bacterium]
MTDRSRSILDYRQLASTYDASCKRIGHIREAAIDALVLQPGQTVVDIACGTGATLLELSERVGPEGKVIGIDHSPEMVEVARQRVSLSTAKNIELLVEPIESACFNGKADALFFCFSHDVLQSKEALRNIFSSTSCGARVVTVGTKLLTSWWAGPLNSWIHWRGRRYRTTEQGLAQPWKPLQEYCPDIRITNTFNLGTSYLAEGTFTTYITDH